MLFMMISELTRGAHIALNRHMNACSVLSKSFCLVYIFLIFVKSGHVQMCCLKSGHVQICSCPTRTCPDSPWGVECTSTLGLGPNLGYRVSPGPVRPGPSGPEIHGYPRVSMDIDGHLLISMDFDGYPWIFIDIHGYPLISIDIH